jgi:acyl-CoA reductase-like NAD-dependent aldehyde dehydrogenase
MDSWISARDGQVQTSPWLKKPKILSYIQIAREEGGQILTGGERAAIAPALDNGFYTAPPSP